MSNERAKFETLASDSFGFKRSPRGTYVNSSVARDWKWFTLGVEAARAAAPVSGQGAPICTHPEGCTRCNWCGFVSGQGASIGDDMKFIGKLEWIMDAHKFGYREDRPRFDAALKELFAYIDSRPRSEDSRAAALLEYFNASTDFANTVGHESATAADEHKAEVRFEAAGDAVRRALATTATPSGPAQEQAVSDALDSCQRYDESEMEGGGVYKSSAGAFIRLADAKAAVKAAPPPAPPSPAVRTLTDAKKMQVDKSRMRLCATCVHEPVAGDTYPCNCCWNPVGDMYRKKPVITTPDSAGDTKGEGE